MGITINLAIPISYAPYLDGLSTYAFLIFNYIEQYI